MPAKPIWSPRPDRVAASRMLAFMRRYLDPTGKASYDDLHRWSVANPDTFWRAVAEHTDVRFGRAPDRIVDDFDRMPGARWFPGATLSYAENLLAPKLDGPALIFVNERGERSELDFAELERQVASTAAALAAAGVEVGDRVAGVLPNRPETVVAALATASLGAIWSSCSPDFGTAALLDRFGQIAPKVLIGVDGYHYNGRTIDCRPVLAELAAKLAGLAAVFVVGYVEAEPSLERVPGARPFADLLARDAVPDYRQVPFDQPLYILYSSGTTGAPKCIVHGAGGTLLQHRKEHVLHTDLKPGDVIFYYTTCGWMMWNWLVSALASGATVVLYDGAPFHPDPGVLWRIAARERINVFGTSARYLSALGASGYVPCAANDLAALRTVLSTGSPLAPAGFELVHDAVGADVQTASISGGTDIVSCFVLGNPLLPVYAGEIQCRGLGMDVRIFDSDGRELDTGKGELVCAKPFPSMPVAFWNDPGDAKYHAAYFERFRGVWCHGDYAELTAHGGIVMHGRSDAVLNPGGVRIGTAEIYRIVEAVPGVDECVAVAQEWRDDTRVVLFVKLAEGASLDEQLREQIRTELRTRASPRHVPARLLAVPDIPRTINGKVSELAVRAAIHGRPVANLGALANPESLAAFEDRPELAE